VRSLESRKSMWLGTTGERGSLGEIEVLLSFTRAKVLGSVKCGPGPPYPRPGTMSVLSRELICCMQTGQIFPRNEEGHLADKNSRPNVPSVTRVVPATVEKIKNHRCNEIGLLPGLSCRSCRRRSAWASVKISVPLCHVHSQDCVLPSSPSL